MSPYLFSRAASASLGLPATALPETEAVLSPSPLRRHLALLNGDFLTHLLGVPGNQVEAIFVLGGEAKSQLEEIFLLLLSRPPTAGELNELLPTFESAEHRSALGQDLAFAILNSREFGSLR